jgi:hypothetical protein
MTPPPSHFTLRMSEDLRANIEAAAASRGVSLNKEITDRLEGAFAPSQGLWLMAGAAKAMVIVFDDKLVAILGPGGRAVPLGIKDADMVLVREFFGLGTG